MKFWGLILLLISQHAVAFSINLNGPISPGSVYSVMIAVNSHMASGEMDLTLRLGSDGGEIPSAVSLANFLRENVARGLEVTTYVRTMCNSSCTIIFAAGQKRKAARGAKFYFHSVGVDGAGKNADAIQFRWAKIWSGQIALVDPRLAQELEENETLVGYMHEKTYHAGPLFENGYTYVTEIP